MIYLARYRSPLGEITLSASENALTGLWFEGGRQVAEIASERPWILRENLPIFKETFRWLDAYFLGEILRRRRSRSRLSVRNSVCAFGKSFAKFLTGKRKLTGRSREHSGRANLTRNPQREPSAVPSGTIRLRSSFPATAL